ncbi:MAG: hypothetical protein KC474_00070 [Cyanobacteria bacterium HKST-UBA04]|nr:hypothetical protein [Cyanobacteria bacterium HKST-UBA04]
MAASGLGYFTPAWAEPISGEIPSRQDRIVRFLENKQWKQAVALMEVNVEENPADVEEAERLMDYYVLMNHRTGQQWLLDTLEQAGAENPKALPCGLTSYLKGLTLIPPAAEQPATLADEPDDANVPPSGEQANQQKNAEALQALAQQVTLCGNQHIGWAYYLQGQACQAANLPAQARLYYLKGLYHNPYHTRTLLALSHLLIQHQRYTQATGYLKQAYDLWPYNPDTLYIMGAYYYAHEHYQAALEFFEHSAALDPLPRPQREAWIKRTHFQLGDGPDPDPQPAPEPVVAPDTPTSP